MHIVSIGTCLTHEIFFDPRHNRLRPPFQGHGYYSYQRTVLPSLMAAPGPVDPAWLQVSGKDWERQWLRDDFEKAFWRDWAARADWVVLDFLSDRRPLYIAKTNPAVRKHYCLLSATNSNITEAAYDRLLPPRGEVLANDPYLALWRSSFRAFLAQLQRVNPHGRVAVHEFSLAPQKDFPTDPVYAYRPLFAALMAEVSATVPAVTILRSRVPAEVDQHHPWGRAPYHLTAAYYDDLADQTARLMGLGGAV